MVFSFFVPFLMVRQRIILSFVDLIALLVCAYSVML